MWKKPPRPPVSECLSRPGRGKASGAGQEREWAGEEGTRGSEWADESGTELGEMGRRQDALRGPASKGVGSD
jgi:hypothetical protein